MCYAFRGSSNFETCIFSSWEFYCFVDFDSIIFFCSLCNSCLFWMLYLLGWLPFKTFYVLSPFFSLHGLSLSFFNSLPLLLHECYILFYLSEDISIYGVFFLLTVFSKLLFYFLISLDVWLGCLLMLKS